MMNISITIEIQEVSAQAKASLGKMQSVRRKNMFESLLHRLCIKKAKKERKSFCFVPLMNKFLKIGMSITIKKCNQINISSCINL